jgi:hypothetical protein
MSHLFDWIRRVDVISEGATPSELPPGYVAAGELLHTALIRLPLKGVEVALGYGRLLGAQGPVS